MRAHHTAAALLCLLAGACARFEIYTDPDMKGAETGFKYYTPKPYVLVSRTDKKDEPLTISIQYLPDLTRPLYAKAVPGWFGNSNLKMVFNEAGTLHDFGQEGDNRIADLVNQLGGFAKSLAEAQKTRAEARKASMAESLSKSDRSKLSRELGAAHVETMAVIGEAGRANKLTKREQDDLVFQAAMVESAARRLADPAQPDANPLVIATLLKSVLDAWKTQTFQAMSNSEARKSLAFPTARIETVLAELTAPVAPPDAHFALYEIVVRDGRMKLVEVPFLPPDPP